MKAFHHRTRRLAAFLIGVVFLVAGLFKLLDPVGAGLVMEDYFKFFHLGFMMPYAKIAAVAMALLEAFLGCALITGIRRKIIAIATIVLVVFFTILTLLLAIYNPPMDCGCFGEAIHLTNLQTFLKNLVLLALSAVAFLPFRDFGENKTAKDVAFILVGISIIAFTVYSWMKLPLVDFTPFYLGSELVAQREEGSIEPEEEAYDATFIYEKDGKEQSFTLEDLPDSTWTFVRTETVQKTKAADESVADLAFTNAAGDYMDDIAVVDDVLAVSVYKPVDLKSEKWTRILETLKGASSAGFTPLLLVASSPEAFDALEGIAPDVHAKLDSLAYYADFRTLVSLNRSNGGATWFSDGQLVRKFAFSDLPSSETLIEASADDPMEEMVRQNTRGRLSFQAFLLYVFAVLLLI